MISNMAYSIVTAASSKHKQLIFGTKAEHLITLIENGLPVPETIILPCINLPMHINELLPVITGKLTPPYIVRSSTQLEDSPAASYAGISMSIPFIRTSTELKKALLRVSNAKISVPVKNYLGNNTKSTLQLNALIVQEYKEPQWSGVIFTENPENSQEMIVEYSNKPHGVTDATVLPSRISFNRNNPVIPNKELVFLNQLIDHALEIEKLFNAPQDIEWIYDRKLWIVQARPITTHASHKISNTVEAEIDRLKSQFGDKAPRLSAQQFYESLPTATPITQSLFQQFFSENGSWGRFLERYHIPHRQYSVETYVPSIFGMLYINKDEEQRILYQSPQNEIQEDNSSRFTVTPGLRQGLSMPLIYVRQLLAATRLRVNTYYNYRRIEKFFVPSNLSENPSLDVLESIRERLVSETVPRLFQVSAHQDYCLQVLHKHLHNRIDSNLWEQLLRPPNPSMISKLLQEVPDEVTLIEKLGHRGPKEFELAEPRWSENPAELFSMYKQPNFFVSRPTTDVMELRKSVINRFAGAWDQQMVETHFILYDYFFEFRERAHDQWIRNLTSMRRVLLKLDEAASLKGLIWYADLQEVFDHYPKLDTVELKKRRNRHLELSAVSLPVELNANSWSSLATGIPPSQTVDGCFAQRLVGGQARGISGTVSDLKKGKPIDILVVKSLDPSLVVYFGQIKGIITEGGGLLSHGTILARELGIPTVSLPQATNIVPTGANVTMDANNERVEIN